MLCHRFITRPKLTAALCAATAIAAFSLGASAQSSWKLLKPGSTGVPGEEVRVMRFDSQGNLWIAARYPFWGDCALAMLSADQLPNPPHPGGGFNTGSWQVWSNDEHPIPSPYIFDFEFAPSGIIWIASEGGLTRFDRTAKTPAQMWHTYNAANTPLIMNSVRSVEIDALGNIWLVNSSVQSSNGALYRFNPASNQWTQYMVGQQLPWYAPWFNLGSVHVGLSGKLYITHDTLGGFAESADAGATWTLRSHPWPLGRPLEDFQGNAWFTSSQAGLIKWNAGTSSFQSFDLGSQGTVTAVGMDSASGMVYAAAWYGNVYRMVNGNTPTFLLNASNIPGSIHPRSNGELFISNYGGNGTLGTVRQYSAAGQLLRRMNTFNSGMPDYFIDNLQRDREGNMWVSCGEGGISRFHAASNTWRNWGNHNDGSEPYPWAGNEPMGGYYLDRNGTGWMGGNGIGQWNPTTGTFSGFWNWQNNPGMGVTMFNSFAEDSAGNLFAGTEYGNVMRFNGTQWVTQPPTAGGYTSSHPGVKSDPLGRVWSIGNLTAWLFNTSTNSWSQVGQQWNLFDRGGATSYAFGADGTLWLGTNNGLLQVQDPPLGAVTVYTHLNSLLPAKQVRGIDVRSDGVIGLSAHEFGSVTPFPNGVAIIRGNPGVAASWTVHRYGTSPLPHYQLGPVQFDSSGNLWVSAVSEGVAVISGGPPMIAGDITGDGVVNVNDLLAVINAWGVCPAPPAPCPADIAPPGGDGVVNVNDLLMVINNWG